MRADTSSETCLKKCLSQCESSETENMDLGCRCKIKETVPCLLGSKRLLYIKKKKIMHLHLPCHFILKKKKNPKQRQKPPPYLPCSSLHIISSHQNTRQSFSYPEDLPIHTLSSVQWFHSSVLQRRCPGQECYRCKQRGETRSHNITHIYFYRV